MDISITCLLLESRVKYTRICFWTNLKTHRIQSFYVSTKVSLNPKNQMI